MSKTLAKRHFLKEKNEHHLSYKKENSRTPDNENSSLICLHSLVKSQNFRYNSASIYTRLKNTSVIDVCCVTEPVARDVSDKTVKRH